VKLDQAIREITDALATYNFSIAIQTLYRFFWSEYCIGMSRRARQFLKGAMQRKKRTLLLSLILSSRTRFRAFHPFLPFITENSGTGWVCRGHAGESSGKTIHVRPWPKPFGPGSATTRPRRLLPRLRAQKIRTRHAGPQLAPRSDIPANQKVRSFLNRPTELPAHDVEV